MTDLTTEHPNASAPSGQERIRGILARMTLDEKLAQLVGFWVDDGGEMVAPGQGQPGVAGTLEEFSRHGLGHLTRTFGTRPVDPTERAAWLRKTQRRLVTETRLGIPAIAHEECLSGFTTWRATTFPTPLAWGASFDPDLVEMMGAAIGASMRSVGVHQGLAPVLDVIRDARWGRVEECLGEDPYLVGTLGTAYVRGMQASGVHATLKHFVGYSNSRAGRNLAPVHAGPREIADVLLVPFEMAVLDGGARSVMNSYAEIDGLPVAADRDVLTGILRERWGFEGTVVADYYSVAFLESKHRIAADPGEAAGLALTAGIDIELPTGNTYLEPLAVRIRDGRFDESIVDRAVLRVLAAKEDLGLLDETFEGPGPDRVDLDPPEHRALAARLAERSIVLLSNDGTLPLASADRNTMPARCAVIGPNADRAPALFGCYSFVNHVLDRHPDTPVGLNVATVLEAMRLELPGTEVKTATGCAVTGDDRSEIAEAATLAAGSDVAVMVMGDQAGLFGRGTSGEGCDTDDLELPGVQRELVEAVLATGTPVVLVLITGRPYAIEWALTRCAAVVQAFFPGQEGASAVAGVLSGRINPSGRLPVSIPRSAGAQPYSYLHPPLGEASDVGNVATAPPLPFGHGLSYTSFACSDLTVDLEVVAGQSFTATVTVTNTGERGGDDVVQLYGHDVVGSVTRPTAQLLAYHRVSLSAGQSAQVRFEVPTTRLAFSGRDLARIVEPGDVELWVGPSCREKEVRGSIPVVGPVHVVSISDPRRSTAVVLPL